MQILRCHLERETWGLLLELWGYWNYGSSPSPNQSCFLESSALGNSAQAASRWSNPHDHRLLSHPMTPGWLTAPRSNQPLWNKKMCHPSQYTQLRLKPTITSKNCNLGFYKELKLEISLRWFSSRLRINSHVKWSNASCSGLCRLSSHYCLYLSEDSNEIRTKGFFCSK